MSEPQVPANDPAPLRGYEEVLVALAADVAELTVFIYGAASVSGHTPNPTHVCAMVLREVGALLAEQTNPEAAQMAMLLTFEGSHTKPMSFIEIGKAKAALEQIAARRRRSEPRPTIIMPGDE